MFTSARFLASLVFCSVAFGQAQFIGGAWSGNVSPTSATVVIRLDSSGQKVRLQVSESESLARGTFSAVVTTAAASGNTAKLSVQGLKPNTDYFYGIEVGGTLRTEQVSRGRFRTFPVGMASFRVAFASCGDFRAANQSAYAAIMNERPLLFINMGDLHYSDTNSTIPEEYRRNYDNVLGHEVQGPLYRSLPVAYMWDDHDFAGNDSDTTAIGRDTARVVYKERVPHYPITTTGGALGQAFTIGRVRFIMTDLRSASTPASQKESANKTRLGVAQKAWFKQELINARDSGFPAIVWVCPDPWIGPSALGDDSWGGHATERTELANFFRDNRITNLTILSGDMHALAFDDGSHSDYATGGGAPVTVLHAAALTSNGSVKGGPYTEGPFPGSQQYGMLEVFDYGGPSLALRFVGMHVGEPAKITRIFSSSSSVSTRHALVNISTLAQVGSDAMTSTFVLSGSPETSVLIRAIGPSLGAFGVKDPLAQPVLSVLQGDEVIASNSAWGSSSDISAAQIQDSFDLAGAFRLSDTSSRDAALMLRLPPGSYTAEVKNGSGTPGSVLLEIYDLP